MCKTLAGLREAASPRVPASQTLHPWNTVDRVYGATMATAAASDEGQALAQGQGSARAALRTRRWSPRAAPCRYQLGGVTGAYARGETQDEDEEEEEETEGAVAALDAFEPRAPPRNGAAVGSRLFFAEDRRLRSRAAGRGAVALNLETGTQVVARALDQTPRQPSPPPDSPSTESTRLRKGSADDAARTGHGGRGFLTQPVPPRVPHLKLPVVA